MHPPPPSLISILSLSLILVIPTSASPTPVCFAPDTSTLPYFRLPVSRLFKPNATDGISKIIERDRARISVLKAMRNLTTDNQNYAAGSNTAPSFSVTNDAVTYIANVGFGSPPTQYNLLVDTGSSNTWLGADKEYKKTSTSKQTPNSVAVTYGSGSFSGMEYTDQVTLSSTLVIAGQGIGVASKAVGFTGVDGILGVGPIDLTLGTLNPEKSGTIPTVTDSLFSQGKTGQRVLGVYFQPTNSQSAMNGELTFGGVDPTKYTGTIAYAPITAKIPAKYYWGVDLSVKYGTAQILSTTGGIVDTGTTLVYIASDAFAKYQASVGGAVDSSTGLLKIPQANVAKMQSLFFGVGAKGVTFEFTANAQLWPRSLNTYIGGEASAAYSVVADIGSKSGSGLDFIAGYAFLERFYSVYDTTNHRVGFATTAFTKATSN